MYEFCEWMGVWRCTTTATHKLKKKNKNLTILQIIFFVLINGMCKFIFFLLILTLTLTFSYSSCKSLSLLFYLYLFLYYYFMYLTLIYLHTILCCFPIKHSRLNDSKMLSYLLIKHHRKLLMCNAGFGWTSISCSVWNYVQMNSLQDVLLMCKK